MIHFIEALINPYFICTCLLVVAMLFAWTQPSSMIIQWCLTVGVIGLLIISTPLIPRWLTYRLESNYAVVNKIDKNIKWIVVLSGGRADARDYPENAQLYSATIKRMVEGVRLYRQIPGAKLLLSGGGYTPNVTEAEGLKLLAQWFGIPIEDVLIEKKSKNTAAQAINIKKMLKTKPFYLVTSATHMPRSMLLFEQQGMTPVAAPTDFTLYWDDERVAKRLLPSGQNVVYTTILLHEYLGTLWAKVAHRA
jgi:uncharacterized SAM-binding protein YcdF (DUF218 family)